ncbi:ATP-binding protein [Geothrix sp. 21YS21S-4]|uniref:sensor histidine kinase n=1 Tax=Geothrix sp. 21YS21S-4 TaxID=3068889 RepID=UPI0027B97B76|nr:ATP-binding protein [Geothrix sp. 21YS21S-4]
MAQRYQLLIRDRHGFERAVPLSRSLTLGRQSLCDVVLPDGMISRHHLRLELQGEVWWAEDLQSTHGTLYKDQRLGRVAWEPGVPLSLADGAYTLTLTRRDRTISELHHQAILETAQLLGHEVDLEDLLEKSLDWLLAISGTDRGFIMLLENGELAQRVQRNLGPELEGHIQLSMSSVHKVFETGDPIWILNVADDHELSSHQSIQKLELKTILCLPLKLQGKRIGVVYLDSRRPVTEPPDREAFEAIVSICAIALERTRLSEENLRSHVLATVGQVASSIVHDFKNGLFVLRGHADLLELSTEDPKIRHHSRKILDCVERLTLLTQDVLDFAKIREPKRETVDLRAFLEGIVEPLVSRARELGVTLKAEGSPCSVKLDPARFTRVMENLLANALDATRDMKGEILVAWGTVNGGVQIRVKDLGRGIPRRMIKRIFEPFFSYGKKKGTGLGMATVKKIVEEHGGTLEFLSEEGEGTEVIIVLPESPRGGRGPETTGGRRVSEEKQA